MANDKLTYLSALKEVSTKIVNDFAKKTELQDIQDAVDAIEVPTKVSDLDNDSDFQTSEEVSTAIKSKLGSAYIASGSVMFSELPEAGEETLGNVYNIKDKFTTTEDFLDGANKRYPDGSNVVVVKDGDAYLYDVMGGFIDQDAFVEKEEGKVLSSNDFTDEEKTKLAGIEIATDEDVASMIAEVFGE